MSEILSYVLPCQCGPGFHEELQARDLDAFVAHLNEIYLSKPKPLPEKPTNWPPTDWVRPREA